LISPLYLQIFYVNYIAKRSLNRVLPQRIHEGRVTQTATSMFGYLTG